MLDILRRRCLMSLDQREYHLSPVQESLPAVNEKWHEKGGYDEIFLCTSGFYTIYNAPRLYFRVLGYTVRKRSIQESIQ
jgi:hypothetical protein